MQLTQKERDETLASCHKNARQCRETAGRLRLPDQRKAMEQTAKMWDDLAATLCGPVAALDELLNNVTIADQVSIVPDTETLDTDESGVAEVIGPVGSSSQRRLPANSSLFSETTSR